MSMSQWKLKVEHVIACNCDWGCPCIYEARPTPGFCEGIVAWRVREGAVDDVDLAGASWVAVIHWPGAIHEGDGRAIVFVDDSISKDQQRVIEKLATGGAGGPIATFMGTCEAGIEVRLSKVRFHFDGKNTSIEVEGSVACDLEAIRNPVTNEEHLVSVDLATGMLNQREDFYSARNLQVTDGGIGFEYSGRHAATSVAEWSGP
jgi:hypothetical protein